MSTLPADFWLPPYKKEIVTMVEPSDRTYQKITQPSLEDLAIITWEEDA